MRLFRLVFPVCFVVQLNVFVVDTAPVSSLEKTADTTIWAYLMSVFLLDTSPGELERSKVEQVHACMKAAFCMDPNRAKSYLAAGKMMMMAESLLKRVGLKEPSTPDHRNIILNLEEAINYGKTNITDPNECETKYDCILSDSIEPSLNQTEQVKFEEWHTIEYMA